MKDYIEYLIQLKIPQINTVYYQAWVDQYIRYCEDRKREDSEESLNQYLFELECLNENWKVDQARKAVKLYRQYQLNDMAYRFRDIYDKAIVSLKESGKSERTQKSYLSWINRFLKFAEDREFLDFNAIENFTVYISSELKLRAASQNQALSSLVYFFQEVLDQDMHKEISNLRVKKSPRLPCVLSKSTMRKVLAKMTGVEQLMATLMYGSGIRSNECHLLRIRDLQFKNDEIVVRSGKERRVLLPKSLRVDLKNQIEKVREIYVKDRQRNYPGVAFTSEDQQAKSWEWFWLFPSAKLSVSPEDKNLYRYPQHRCHLREKFKEAFRKEGIAQKCSLDILRHSFAVHILESGINIRAVQDLLGHRDIWRVMVYQKLAKLSIKDVRSPLDTLYERLRREHKNDQDGRV